MNKILTILIFCFAVLAAKGQQSSTVLSGPTTKAIIKGGLQVDSAISIPNDTIMRSNWPKTLGALASKNGKLFLWSTSLQKWVESGGADSSVYATKAWTGSNFAPLSGYNKANWDLAYSWGNHASAGYLTSSSASALYAPISGSGNYIQNGTTAQSANFNINGNGIIYSTIPNQFSIGYSSANSMILNVSSQGQVENKIKGSSSRYDISIPIAQADAIPQMTSYNTPFGEATASSIYDASFDAWKAFDNDGSTYWNATDGNTVPNFLQYKFSSAKNIVKYTIQSNNANSNVPIAWQFQASNDGSVWTTLDTRSGVSFPSGGYKNTFTFTNSNYYIYYRVYITATTSGKSGIGEVEMMESESYGTAFSIGNNGFTGLNKINPSYQLDVNGDAYISGITRLGNALGLANLSTAPTGANGAVYYNSTSNTFQGYRNGAWNSFDMAGDAIKNQNSAVQAASAWINGNFNIGSNSQTSYNLHIDNGAGGCGIDFIGTAAANKYGNLIAASTSLGMNLSINQYSTNGLITRLGSNYLVNTNTGVDGYKMKGNKKTPIIELNAENGSISFMPDNTTGADMSYFTPINGLTINPTSINSYLPLIHANLSTAPTGSNGAAYYNSTSNQFQGYRNGAWGNFLMSGDVTGSQWTTAGSTIYYQSGAVTIGTTAPVSSEVLRVHGELAITAGKINLYNGSPIVGNTYSGGQLYPSSGYGTSMGWNFEGSGGRNYFLGTYNPATTPGTDNSAIIVGGYNLQTSTYIKHIYMKEGGVFQLLALKTTGAAPTTTGAIRLVQVDANGQLSFITAASLGTYSDDTAAGAAGLTSGTPYKKADGTLMIKL